MEENHENKEQSSCNSSKDNHTDDNHRSPMKKI